MAGDLPSFEIHLALQEVDTYDLRQRVSADGIVLPTWHHELDDIPGARYLGARTVDGRVIGTASLYPAPFPNLPDVVPALRLMFMAVEPELQHLGIGSALMGSIVQELQARNVRILWATARDVAIPFYRRFGFIVGEPSLAAPNSRPHHYLHLPLSP
ncbi:MAG: GNAT family N-acetyltransferase [Candidatus Dormibacteraceae bacterium]